MLQSLTSSIEWLREVNEEIAQKFQLVGDTASLTVQNEQCLVSHSIKLIGRDMLKGDYQ